MNMQKYLTILALAMFGWSLNCAGQPTKLCTAEQLGAIAAECLALQAAVCPDQSGDGGQGGQGPSCAEVKASCESRISAWETCK